VKGEWLASDGHEDDVPGSPGVSKKDLRQFPYLFPASRMRRLCLGLGMKNLVPIGPSASAQIYLLRVNHECAGTQRRVFLAGNVKESLWDNVDQVTRLRSRSVPGFGRV
jgi:hypothetical protein